MAVIILMAVKNEYLTHEDNFKGIHDDENNVCFVTGDIFSSFLPLLLCSLAF